MEAFVPSAFPCYMLDGASQFAKRSFNVATRCKHDRLHVLWKGGSWQDESCRYTFPAFIEQGRLHQLLLVVNFSASDLHQKQTSVPDNSGISVLLAQVHVVLVCREEGRGFQLYQSHPSGNYGSWKATAMGGNHQAATNILKQDYKDDITLQVNFLLVLACVPSCCVGSESQILSCWKGIRMCMCTS